MVFTGATTNAGRIIDHGITAPVAVLDHRDGLRQAMACTIAADNAIPRDEALLLVIAGQPHAVRRGRIGRNCQDAVGQGRRPSVTGRLVGRLVDRLGEQGQAQGDGGQPNPLLGGDDENGGSHGRYAAG